MLNVSQDSTRQDAKQLRSASFVKRLGASLLSLCLLFAGLQASVAQAAMISTQKFSESGTQQNQSYDRQQLLQRLQQADARQAMQRLGVDPSELNKRINAMTDSELAQFNHQVQQLPAGGDGIFGVVIFVLLILIVLDLLGATNIFPAIHPIGTYKK